MFQAQIGLIRKLRISAFLAGAFLFLLSGLFVFPMASSVDETQATSKQSETVLTISADDLTLYFEIDSANGSFAEDSADISVTTNNITGYTLSINTGNTGDNAGKLVGENQSFNPISSATSETDFTNSADYNGLWGYKPSKVNGEANTSYLPAPTETTTIEETDAPNQEANVYEIGLGARADMSYEAGGYTNTFVITGVANPVGYVISYDDNTDDAVTNMPTTQSDITTDTVITLAEDVPVRVGYDFKGWCDGVASGDTCTGTTYQPGDDFDIYQTTTNNKTLYALWQQTNNITVNYKYGVETNVVVYACRLINNATVCEEQPVSGSYVVPTPAAGKRFAGWDTNSSATTAAHRNEAAVKASLDVNTSTIDLYAIWKDNTDPPGTEGGSINDDSSKWQANSLLRAFELAYVEAGYPMYIEDSTVTAPIPGWRPMTSEDVATIGDKETRFAMQDISLTFTEDNVTQGVCEWAAPSLADNTYIDEALVMDKRDGKSYWILKAADGKCWMTQNLDFDIPATALTSDATDLTEYGADGYTSEKGYSRSNSIISWVPERATIPTSDISSSGSISGWTNDSTNPYSVDTGNWYWTDDWYDNDCSSAPTYCNYLSGNENGKFSTTLYPDNGLHGHVGNFYNWTAAIASNDSSNYNSSTYLTTSNNPQNSICPAGWRLPVIGGYNTGQLGTNDFYDLSYKYGNTLSTDQYYTARPLWFIRGGDVSFTFNSDTLRASGYIGYYWSSTVGVDSVQNGFRAYYLNLRSNAVGLGSSNDVYRYSGFSVRCVARDVVPADPDPNVTTFDEAFAAANKTKDTTTSKYKMQDMNTSICNAVTNPTASDYSDTPETQLVDTRDGKVYWVSKLMDGHCWMTQNLDLDLETTATNVAVLTSENTDLNTYGSNGYDSENGYSRNGNNVITWTPRRSTLSTASISSTGEISDWSNTGFSPYSIDVGDWYWIGNWNDNGVDTWYSSVSNNYLSGNLGDPAKFKKNESFYDNGTHGHVGNYYNWTAAIASNYSNYNASTYSDTTGNPQNSICPTGWRLPTISDANDTAGSTNEFQRLITLYGNNSTDDKALTASPLWFVRGGFINYDRLGDSGYDGNYWSSTVKSTYNAYYLYFSSSSISPTGNFMRDYGRSVRCVVR